MRERSAASTAIHATPAAPDVPVWRDGAGNAGLEAATRDAFSDLGGMVLEGVRYGATSPDLAATVAALRAQVDQALGQHGTERVAVYLAAFDEVVRLFAHAAAGATGWTVLNEAGDRRHGDYDFWAIRMQQGSPQWSRVAQYESRTGRLCRW